jgi:hypothetical protein
MSVLDDFPDVYEAKVIADSVNSCGNRMTTMSWTFPRFILAEVNTHRMLSKNASSSRYMPVESIIQKVENTPALPAFWGSDKKGMVAGDELEGDDLDYAKWHWNDARRYAIQKTKILQINGLYRGLTNRLLEPWMPCTIIISGTNGWANLFALRCHPAAQHEFQRIANLARTARDASVPRLLKHGEWHLPFIDEDLRDCKCEAYIEEAKKCSAIRCARASRYSAEGETTVERDLKSYNNLVNSNPPHASPFEHVAMALDNSEHHRNLRGFLPMRVDIPNDYQEDNLYEGPTQ